MSSGKTINLTLKIWRQKNNKSKGKLETYQQNDVMVDMSFLEMIDVLNEKLTLEGKEPVAFSHDCREGICGECGCMVNGKAHGPVEETTLCQLHMRHFKDGDTIFIEPFRAKAFKIAKDLVVDRESLDNIIAAGGYVSVRTGSAQDANNIPVKKEKADLSMDAASCIGCGACIAACPNASASLFTSAKISQLALLPQGEPEQKNRAKKMIKQMDLEKFGNCSNAYQCEAACPKGIKVSNIARMNREFIKSDFG